MPASRLVQRREIEVLFGIDVPRIRWRQGTVERLNYPIFNLWFSDGNGDSSYSSAAATAGTEILLLGSLVIPPCRIGSK